MSTSYSALFVRELLDAMVANGVQREEMLTRTGLRDAMLKNPFARVPSKFPEAMFEAALELVDHPDWGLRIARYLSENSQRLTTLILFTAPSIRKGMHRAEKLQHLNTTRAWFELTDEESSPCVHAELHFPNLKRTPAGIQMIEATIGGICLYVARFAGKDPIFGQVTFRHEPAMDRSLYENFFRGLSLHFGAEKDELIYSREDLDKYSPLADYNRQVHLAIASRAEALYQRLFGSSNLEKKVREELKKQFEESPSELSLESVASALSLTSRTLQRKLGKNGFSFNDLAEDERRGIFDKLIVDESISFSEIGARCGFRSRESLYRSVRRWYGMKPSEYRQKVTQQAKAS